MASIEKRKYNCIPRIRKASLNKLFAKMTTKQYRRIARTKEIRKRIAISIFFS